MNGRGRSVGRLKEGKGRGAAKEEVSHRSRHRHRLELEPAAPHGEARRRVGQAAWFNRLPSKVACSAALLLFKIGRYGTTRKPVGREREGRAPKGSGRTDTPLAENRPIAASDERHDHIRKSGPKPAKGRRRTRGLQGGSLGFDPATEHVSSSDDIRPISGFILLYIDSKDLVFLPNLLRILLTATASSSRTACRRL